MCRAVVDAEDKYDRHLFMLKAAQGRERVGEGDEQSNAN